MEDLGSAGAGVAGGGGVGVEGVTAALPVAQDISVTLDHRAIAPASFSPSPDHRR